MVRLWTGTLGIVQDIQSTGQVFSDDLYMEIHFAQLYNEWCKIKKEEQRFKVMEANKKFQERELRNHV